MLGGLLSKTVILFTTVNDWAAKAFITHTILGSGIRKKAAAYTISPHLKRVKDGAKIIHF